MHTVNVAPLVTRLRDAIRFAGTIKRVERDGEARALWHDIYDSLSEGLPGRSEAALSQQTPARSLRVARAPAARPCR
jgi:hypothetical protein